MYSCHSASSFLGFVRGQRSVRALPLLESVPAVHRLAEFLAFLPDDIPVGVV